MTIRNLRRARPEISIYRRTAILLESDTGGGAPTAQPAQDAYIEIQADGACDVAVLGIVSNVVQVETVSLNRAGMKRTVRRFTTVDSISTTSDVSMTARSVGADGSRIDNSVLIATVRAHFDWSGGDWHKRAQGSSGTSSPWYGVDWTSDFTPRRGDIIHDGTMRYEIKKVDEAYGGRGPHHWELHVEEAHGIG